jgi:branched-chain amino acid transport system permease protein
MLVVEILITGAILGGMYALTALGLTLQYGVARIMNLAYGEIIVAAAMTAFWMYTGWAVSPLVGLIAIVPVAFILNWLVYRALLVPLVRRAKTRESLEVDSILATFGLLFVILGLDTLLFGGEYHSYSYLAFSFPVLGAQVPVNRLIALGFAAVIGGALYLALTRTRGGTALRAVAVDPTAAQLVAIDVERASALAFALGGALAAAGGALVSMFLTFNASIGVVFTMKALIVVIMGGIGNLMGALVAGLLLGLAETYVARVVDPGLTLAVTYALFLLILLLKPTGLFGKAAH